MLEYEYKEYDDLLPREIFEIFKLRQDVFILEQECLYGDIDDIDLQAIHLLGKSGAKVLAYLRVIGPTIKRDMVSLGRVVIADSLRGENEAYNLMSRGIAICGGKYPGKNVFISSQTYLIQFYENLGFEKVSAEYLEDGIPHCDMVRKT